MLVLHTALLGALTLTASAAPATFDDIARRDASTSTTATSAASSSETGTATKTSSSTSTATRSTGRYDLPDMPNVCKDSTIPLQTTIPMHDNQVDVFPYGADDGGSSRWAGDQPFNWTFSTDTPGIYFDMPAIPGTSPCNDPSDTRCLKLDIVPRTNGSSFTLQMTNKDIDVSQVVWSVWKAEDGKDIPADCWNATSYATMPKTCPTASNVDFDLQVSGSSPCAHPTGNMSCADNTIPRTKDAWTAFDVDGFFGNWLNANRGKFGTGANSMMQLFASQFTTSSGTGSICNIEHDCNTLSICDNLPDGGNSTQAAQIYLTWVALENLSDTFNRMWQMLNTAQGDATDNIPNMLEQFWAKDPPPAAPGVSPLSKASTILGLIGAVMGKVPGATGTAGGWVGFVGTVVGAANTFDAGTKPPAAVPDPIANLSSLSTLLGNFVQDTRGNLLDTYSQVFDQGLNISTILSGGSFVNRTDLQLDDSNTIKSGVGWMDQYLGLKTLNMAWWANNVFITYVPYGTVIQVGATDGSGTLATTKFDEGACVSNFQQHDWGNSMKNESTLTICHTDGWKLGKLPAGMARLTWYNPSNQDPTPHNSDGYLNIFDTAPGALNDVTFNVTGGGGWKLNIGDIVQSSVQAFATGGFRYDPAYNDLHSSANKQFDLPALAGQMFNSTPSDAGTFNLPVCVLNNLNQWPTLYQVDGSGAWSSPGYVDTYCVCARTLDMFGTNFTSVVPQALAGKMTDPPSLSPGCMQADIYGAEQLALPKMS